jgi:multimeric flavodoxin WrbA
MGSCISTFGEKYRGRLAMKVIAVNGSPRKKWNTATLLQKSLEGAITRGAETELIHLYDIEFKGCVSCFACKTIAGPSYGRCIVKDGLTPLLQKIETTDALILGAPIYFGTVTGEMSSFMERLFFPYYTYTDPPGSIFPRKIRTGFIYTLGATEELAEQRGFDKHIAFNELFMKLIFGDTETLCSYDTYQFQDYSKVFAPRWDPEKKAKRRAEIFPLDCAKAFEMGVRAASQQ